VTRFIGDGGHRRAQPIRLARLFRPFGHNPWTARSYDRCLLLAFLYPLASMAAFWVLHGGDGQFGGWLVLPASSWH